LKSVNTDGGISSALTLPNNVTLATNLTPRFARFKRYIVVVNTPSRPLSVDTSGVVRVLTPAPPNTAVVLSAGAAGTLTGTYLALQTYKLLDANGNTISESDYGPAEAAAFTVTNQNLHANFPLSSDNVSATQLYRTTTNGAVYFPWTLVPGNTITDIENSISDAALGLIAGPSLGTAPDLTLIAEFGGRLWGVDRNKIDDLRYTEAGTMYAWSQLNTLPIPHLGSDGAGITALIPRRAALGVTRRDVFSQVTGTTRSNISATVVSGGEQTGCVSQESAVVFNDIAYFLFRDGVYKWDSNGISCVSNGRVRGWFTTDDTFNRSMFWRAFAQLDPVGLKYRLFLASKGSAQIDRWVEYDLLTGAWWGPHLTTAFNPSCALLVAGRDQQPFFMIGSLEGYLSQDQEAKNDWGLASINMSVKSKSQFGSDPDYEHYFGEVTVFGPIQPAGNVTVTPAVKSEGQEVPFGTAFSYDMTLGRARLGRVGRAQSMTLQFDHNVINQDVVLHGFEVNPVFSIGRR
jgi:hypothetical protein